MFPSVSLMTAVPPEPRFWVIWFRVSETFWILQQFGLLGEPPRIL